MLSYQITNAKHIDIYRDIKSKISAYAQKKPVKINFHIETV